VIKYLGSKRRLVPVLERLAVASGATTALDAFTGTTRVAQAWKRLGLHVTAVDRTRMAHTLARAAIGTDGDVVDHAALAAAVAALDALPGRGGYVTRTFCREAMYFSEENGGRIDAIRGAIADEHANSPWEPLLLTSLLLAADKVDSTVGVQMAYLKRLAPRARNRLQLQPPALLAGPGRAVLGAVEHLVPTLGGFGLAYLDPPYNQHRYEANYHVWETLVAGDEPDAYGVARKRIDLRDRAGRSAFNGRRTFLPAMATLLSGLDAQVVVVSVSDEAWVSLDELRALLDDRGATATLSIEQARYVGARIGIHDPQGRRVGEPGRLRNVEHLLLAGPRARVRAAAVAAAAASTPASSARRRRTGPRICTGVGPAAKIGGAHRRGWCVGEAFDGRQQAPDREPRRDRHPHRTHGARAGHHDRGRAQRGRRGQPARQVRRRHRGAAGQRTACLPRRRRSSCRWQWTTAATPCTPATGSSASRRTFARACLRPPAWCSWGRNPRSSTPSVTRAAAGRSPSGAGCRCCAARPVRPRSTRHCGVPRRARPPRRGHGEGHRRRRRPGHAPRQSP
jgi:adenine-specific DNA-methyltransferase